MFGRDAPSAFAAVLVGIVLPLAASYGPVAVAAAQGGGSAWEWGSRGAPLESETEYQGTLYVTNMCTSTELVEVDVRDIPGLVVNGGVTTVVVPGQTTKIVPATYTAKPPLLFRTNGGLVFGDDRDNDPRHRLCYVPRGGVVLRHAGDERCLPKETFFEVTAHVHAKTVAPPPPPPAPEKLLTPDPCTVWWNTGQRPPGDITEAQCAETMRALAALYIERSLRPLAEASPAAWSWLPSPGAVMSMSVADLLAMKARAAAVMSGSPR